MDKLLPSRRVSAGSSSELDEDEEIKLKIDQLPDASHVDHLPLTANNCSEFNICIPAYTAAVTDSGRTVAVATQVYKTEGLT